MPLSGTRWSFWTARAPSCAPGSATTSQDAARSGPGAAKCASLPRIGSIAGWRVQPNMDSKYSRSIWPNAVAEGPCSLISTESRQALTRFLARHGFEAAVRCGRNKFPTAFRWSEQTAARAQADPAKAQADAAIELQQADGGTDSRPLYRRRT